MVEVHDRPGGVLDVDPVGRAVADDEVLGQKRREPDEQQDHVAPGGHQGDQPVAPARTGLGR
jgi:hypothetical protein